ncbi:hypothetical protein [Streptomyces sp. RFCAC02]|uniref:hypothetical protein n=1 Tax=Streptomyces sp. RFCAC02 TaxID=2499143 RepID=UPI0010210A10|nr:hypothetical protein [Streptomyces sp. RFCAC02]
MTPNFGRLFSHRTTGRPGEWFYCLKHRAVEEGPDCPAKDRLGPYPTREEAQHAVDTARARDEAWRTDPRWNDRPARRDGDGGGDETDG